MDSGGTKQVFAAILSNLEGLRYEVEMMNAELDKANGRIEDLEAEVKVTRLGLDSVKG